MECVEEDGDRSDPEYSPKSTRRTSHRTTRTSPLQTKNKNHMVAKSAQVRKSKFQCQLYKRVAKDAHNLTKHAASAHTPTRLHISLRWVCISIWQQERMEALCQWILPLFTILAMRRCTCGSDKIRLNRYEFGCKYLFFTSTAFIEHWQERQWINAGWVSWWTQAGNENDNWSFLRHSRVE